MQPTHEYVYSMTDKYRRMAGNAKIAVEVIDGEIVVTGSEIAILRIYAASHGSGSIWASADKWHYTNGVNRR